jgi:hypothetical protein
VIDQQRDTTSFFSAVFARSAVNEKLRRTSVFYYCRGISTNHPIFLQNEPKFQKSQMNVNNVLTMNYEKNDTWWTQKKRTQTNPNEPKQTQSRTSPKPPFLLLQDAKKSGLLANGY